MREIRLTNTLTGKKEIFIPKHPGKVTYYTCGPTVYGLIHIGNLRAALVSDMVTRYLKRVGYAVTYVRNYTDVDDKIIKKANEEKVDSDVIVTRYISEVERDYTVAGMHQPTHKPRVTDHMPEIITMIQKIIANGKGYEVDGEVFYSITDTPDYGKLSKKVLEELTAGIRVEVDTRKRNPLDFSLWKPAKPGEPFWESPWGKGRPGWHIECSAMSYKWLGEEIDLHHGGEDLIFPHHENEIAQSEAATCHKPFVRYWIHNGFLNINKEKMSKSLGNIISARDFLTRYSGEVTRFFLLCSHYRSVIDFTDESIDHALSALERIFEAKLKAQSLLTKQHRLPDMRAEGLWGEFVSSCEAAKKEMDEAYANDFNIPGALAALFSLIREFNRILTEPKAADTPTSILGAQALIQVIENDLGEVLGVGRANPESLLQKIQEIRSQNQRDQGKATLDPSAIEQKLTERKEARTQKNFQKADEIRKYLDANGIVIKDNPDGTTSWTVK